MGMYDAGLPKKSVPNGLPLGAVMTMPEIGPLVTLGDGSQWLKSGYLLPKAGYEAAAKVVALGGHIFSWTASAALATGTTGIATNGTGTYVICFGDAANVYVSTDYGVT